jgi:Oxidoreductase family, C-terminal alpha/beta domain/Oxidoreductase family, NAD-binding Rossmann fold
MAGIGIGNQGRGDMVSFLNNKNVQYVAVCDARKGTRDQSKDKVDEFNNNKDCKTYVDFRELLARTDIDAVHIATPDHWHAIQAIEACRSGKDVYCQKPECRTLREGQLMIDTVRRYGSVFSGGSQRVLEDYREVVNKCWGGEHGKIQSINVNVGPLPMACNLPEETCPEDIDWEMWLGPAPWAPYNSKRCNGSYSIDGNSWRSFNDYSSGGLTDWGAHHFGGATYAVDVRELQPAEITFHHEDGKKFLTFTYPNGIKLTHNMPGKGNMEVVGTPGKSGPAKTVPKYSVKGGIYADFLNCVKTRENPFRSVEFAINSAAVSHLALIAYSLERSLKWDAAKQEFPGDQEANRFLDRARREPWQL